MARLPFDPERTRAARRGSRRTGGAGGDTSTDAGADASARPLTVSELAERLKVALADHFPEPIRVVGEISNLSRRQHWFFSLKDERQATLRCVCFASNVRRIATPVEDGMEVVATGRLDFYPGQGHVQLYVESIQPVGQGALELKLRQLIDELREQGYFDESHKQPLPTFPTNVAVVTSRSGAALQDVINTAHRRWPGCRLMLYDVRVQGAGAAPEIAAALRQLAAQGPALGIDAVILTRGGGSLEDLWAFNERAVADAIYACDLPVVAAIGHETDTTVAELVADVRCATPTQAAMRLIPERDVLEQQLGHLAGRLRQDMRRQLGHLRHRLESAANRALFRRPHELTERARRELAQLVGRFTRALPQRIGPARQRLSHFAHRLDAGLPARVAQHRRELARLAPRVTGAGPRRLAEARRQLEGRARHLEAVSPNRVLQRGYTYTLDEHGTLVRHAAAARIGQRLTTVFADGRVHSRVESAAAPTTANRKSKREQPRRSNDDAATLF